MNSPRFDSYINSHTKFLENPYVKTALAVLIVSYGGLFVPLMGAPNLSNPLVRLSILIVILYMGTKMPGMAILLATTAILTFIHCDHEKREKKVRSIREGSNNLLDIQTQTKQSVVPYMQGPIPSIRESSAQ